MCGIAGFLTRDGMGDPRDVLQRMADTLQHRGPDDEGAWHDADAGVGLAHRRLAVVDLSPHGHQPMSSASGRYMLIYNGEIYNFASVRAELERTGPQPVFRGHSDTEVMLAAIERWGLHAAVARFIGMFAFALWDRAERRLHLVRDRLGIKPMYYAVAGDTLLFGSQLSALRIHSAFQGEIDRDALALYLRHGYIPAPFTIYRGVRKLPPGCILTVGRPSELADPVPYWSARTIVERSVADPFLAPDDVMVDTLHDALSDAVRLRMIADVPLGAFLSGGIDSATVVALMQAASTRPVKTFTIGFSEADYDESQHAKAIAAHLGTDHTELIVSPADARDVIPQLPSIYDEPFADSSQIPTYLVSRLARSEVTVSLSGDGGDELFAGYNRHVWGTTVLKWTKRLPRPLRAASASALGVVPPRSWDRGFSAVNAVLPRAMRHRNPGVKIQKLSTALRAGSPETLYRSLVSLWEHPTDIVRGASEPMLWWFENGVQLPTFVERMMYIDLVSYLPDDILTKVDRASMAVSLEARVPLLDHNVVEFAWRLPLHAKLRNGESKWVLRRVLDRYVPRPLMERPKTGFGIPLGAWLRGPLRSWAEDLLHEGRLRSDGYFAPDLVRQAWHDHLSGRANHEHRLWCVLMFQAWLDERTV